MAVNQTSHTPASYKVEVAQAARLLVNLGVLDNLDSDANLVKAVRAISNKLERDEIALYGKPLEETQLLAEIEEYEKQIQQIDAEITEIDSRSDLNLTVMAANQTSHTPASYKELLESTELPEGTRVLVTLLPDDEAGFWLQASQTSLNVVWDNTEDDIYAQLLQT
jgi:hypothetical protein